MSDTVNVTQADRAREWRENLPRLLADLDGHASALYRDIAKSDLWSTLVAARDYIASQTTLKDGLLPCPFCGATPTGVQYGSYELCDGWNVSCTGAKDCPLFYATPYRVWDTMPEAITAWNTHHD